ncbi:MAG: hypothetical protein LBR22_10420 [Desulfovibrio sp.]|nr:hypothetical protein [Desulfovibrio sp.]
MTRNDNIIEASPTGLAASMCASRTDMSIPALGMSVPVGRIVHACGGVRDAGGGAIDDGIGLAIGMHGHTQDAGIGCACGTVIAIQDQCWVEQTACLGGDAAQDTGCTIATGASSREAGVSGKGGHVSDGGGWRAVLGGVQCQGEGVVVMGGGPAVGEGIRLVGILCWLATVLMFDLAIDPGTCHRAWAMPDVTPHPSRNGLAFMGERKLDEVGFWSMQDEDVDRFTPWGRGIACVWARPGADFCADLGVLGEGCHVETGGCGRVTRPGAFAVGDVAAWRFALGGDGMFGWADSSRHRCKIRQIPKVRRLTA